MKKLLLLLTVLLMTSCASFQLSTLNHDPIYSIEGSDAEITVINNEFELQRLLRDDFNFRYDFAQYAKSQPISFDWNNRILRNSRFNRYNYNNRYSWSNGWGYSSYWNRDQMWDDWLWGYQYGNGIGWSYSWNNNRWSSNSWNHPNWYLGSNLYYNQYNQSNRRYRNTSYNIGRRTTTRTQRTNNTISPIRINKPSRRVTQYQIPNTTRRRTNTRTQRTNNTISPIRINKPSRRVTPSRNTTRRNTNVQMPRRRVSRASPTTTRRTTPIIVKKSRNK